MTDFDDRFSDRVREAFDAYEEPVDEAAWARTQAALASGAAAAASRADRAPLARQRPLVRRRWAVPLVLLLMASGVGLWSLRDALESPAPAIVSLPAVPEADSADPAPGVDPAQSIASAAEVDGPQASGSARAVVPEPRTARASGGQRVAAVPRRSRDVPTAPRPERGLPEPASGDPVQTADAPRGDADLAQTVDGGSATAPEVPEIARTPDESASPEAPSVVILLPEPLATFPQDDLRLEAMTEGLSFVVASTSAFSDGGFAEGLGGSAGVVREYSVARGLSVSGGAVAAYNRFTLAPAGDASPTDAFSDIENDPTLSIDVPDQSSFSTLALEIPLDVALDVFRAPGGRIGVSAGVTSAVYLAQEFRENGQTYSADVVRGSAGDIVTLEAQSYTSRDVPGPLSRIDLARQLNLGVRFTANRAPLAVEGYTRLPLGGLTSQNLYLTTLGVRLRITFR